jgi:hypothetical protein
MKITKEQFKEYSELLFVLGFDPVNPIYNRLEKMIEPEAEICSIWKAGKDSSIVPGAQYCTDVDLGSWNILDNGDHFWLKSSECVFKFLKKSPHGYNNFFKPNAPEFQRLEKP